MKNKKIEYAGERVHLAWPEDGGAFPGRVTLDGVTLIGPAAPWLCCELGDGTRATPCRVAETDVRLSRRGGAWRLEMSKLGWRGSDGRLLDAFQLALRFECWPDGTTFVNAFFLVESTEAPEIASLALEIPLDLSGYPELAWGFLARPRRHHDSTDIQSAAPERFLPRGGDRRFDGQLLPQVSFDLAATDRAAAHVECFVEAHSTLTGRPEACRTEILWTNGQPRLRWSFHVGRGGAHGRPWQWRNQFGWLVAAAPTRRRLPPLRMFQYFDNYQRYPTDRQMDKIVATGADVLVLHENWRMDAQNGGVPYDAVRLRQLVARAHAAGLRIALYIRGNEHAAVEEACDWYGAFLKPGDGLYMDFGSPLSRTRPPDENAPGGHVLYRSHYLAMRQRRRLVGSNGVLFSHTGPSFSAVGMTGGLVDGYVAGEGERGVMVRDRRHHAYFSAASSVPGSMWTAAFPEYGTAAMVPFLAVTGQFPHVPLGTQFYSSSLTHPREPGINDRYLRPLWRLWGLLRGCRDLAVFNDYNGTGAGRCDAPSTGFSMLATADRRSALLLLANFDGAPREGRVAIDWPRTGVAPTAGWRLAPGFDAPGDPLPLATVGGEFTASLPAHGVAGWLLTSEPEAWRDALAAYAQPYPPQDAHDCAWLEAIGTQRRLRETPPPWPEVWMRVAVQNLSTPYEESLWWDLFDNAMELGTLDDAGAFRHLRWITRHGLADVQPDRPDYIWPGHASPWIPLRPLAPAGARLAVRSIHLGEPFYSFIDVTLSPTASCDSAAYTLTFYNELEPQREVLHWRV